MSDARYVESVIFCDQVRFEASGQEIAIGIYPGTIAVPRAPFIADTFMIRFELFFSGVITKSVRFRLLDPTGEVLFTRQLNVSFNDWNQSGSVVAVINKFVLPVLGEYVLETMLEGQSWVRARSLLLCKVDHSAMQAVFQHMLEDLNT